MSLLMAIMAFPPLVPKINAEYILFKKWGKAFTFSKPPIMYVIKCILLYVSVL